MIKLTDLKYCVRLRHSKDMPLKKPRKNCAFKEGDECSWHPAHLRYCEENDIDLKMNFGIRFRCILTKRKINDV